MREVDEEAAFAKRLIKKAALGGVSSIAILTVLLGSWYTVDQTEMAFVRRNGTVLQDRHHPIGPGLHFKMPLIDSVDKLQVSLKTIKIPEFDVLTVDNQKVSIEENFNYTVSPNDVYHVLYEVGRAGDVDIHDQVIPVAHDRTARIFAGWNMVTVNANREAIQAEIEKSIIKTVEDLFGITPHSLQIAAIKPSAGFMASIDQATMAKNAAIAAENELRTKQFQAQQAAATAKGAADAAIEQARGAAESVKLNAQAAAEATRLTAEAEKKRLVLEGEGLQANLANQISPFGSPEKYTAYLNAKAQLNWDGRQPQFLSGGNGGGASTNFVIPLPAPK